MQERARGDVWGAVRWCGGCGVDVDEAEAWCRESGRGGAERVLGACRNRGRPGRSSGLSEASREWRGSLRLAGWWIGRRADRAGERVSNGTGVESRGVGGAGGLERDAGSSEAEGSGAGVQGRGVPARASSGQ